WTQGTDDCHTHAEHAERDDLPATHLELRGEPAKVAGAESATDRTEPDASCDHAENHSQHRATGTDDCAAREHERELLSTRDAQCVQHCELAPPSQRRQRLSRVDAESAGEHD